MGERPTPPELLDWLAAELLHRRWSLKQLHRLIVTSATYRQSSRVREDLKDRDPDNRLLARHSRLRLSAELIRDAALQASGLLYPAVGGKSIRPVQPESISKLTYANGAPWQESEGPDRYRRGLYIHYQRTSPYPQLVNFDEPDSNTACTRRRRSNSPLQALNLLNDPVFVEAAQALAARVLAEAPDEPARIERMFRLCLGRAPDGAERESYSVPTAWVAGSATRVRARLSTAWTGGVADPFSVEVRVVPPTGLPPQFGAGQPARTWRLDEARRLFDGFHHMVTDDAFTPQQAETLGKLAVFAGVKKYPVRVKCATLPWHTLKAAMENRGESVSTE